MCLYSSSSGKIAATDGWFYQSSQHWCQGRAKCVLEGWGMRFIRNDTCISAWRIVRLHVCAPLQVREREREREGGREGETYPPITARQSS
jgi:hypothetical protein